MHWAASSDRYVSGAESTCRISAELSSNKPEYRRITSRHSLTPKVFYEFYSKIGIELNMPCGKVFLQRQMGKAKYTYRTLH
jgi:hypothetical protein